MRNSFIRTVSKDIFKIVVGCVFYEKGHEFDALLDSFLANIVYLVAPVNDYTNRKFIVTIGQIVKPNPSRL